MITHTPLVDSLWLLGDGSAAAMLAVAIIILCRMTIFLVIVIVAQLFSLSS